MKALEIYSFVDHKKHIKREGGSQVEIEKKEHRSFARLCSKGCFLLICKKAPFPKLRYSLGTQNKVD